MKNTQTGFRGLLALAFISLAHVYTAQATLITPGAGSNNHGFAQTTFSPILTDSVTNTLADGNPSPWLDPIYVHASHNQGNALSTATAQMFPSFISSDTGATYEMGMTSLAAGYGSAVLFSEFFFTLDDPTSFALVGSLEGSMGGGGTAHIEARLEHFTTASSVFEVEFNNGSIGMGSQHAPYNYIIGDNTAQSDGWMINGSLSGAALAPGNYRLYMEHRLDYNTGGDPATGNGLLSLVLGDGGNYTPPVPVPEGGSTALLLGFVMLGFYGFGARPKQANHHRR